MANKYPSGFSPIPFKTLGKILLPISALLIAVTALDALMRWDAIPGFVLFLGLGFLIVGLYLRFVVPED